MKPTAEPAAQRRESAGRGRTERSDASAKPLPRRPDEHDESADSQRAVPRDAGEPGQATIGRRAHDDLAAGRVDTGEQPVTDAVYRRQQTPTR